MYDRKVFLSDIAKLCRKGGIVVFTTINKSFLGIFFGKYFAENILRIVPKGTHNVQKLITPETLAKESAKHNIILDSFTGFKPTFKIEDIINREFGDFKLTSSLEINYGAAGIKI